MMFSRTLICHSTTSRVVRRYTGERQPLHDLMTPWTVQSNVGIAMPMTTSCPKKSCASVDIVKRSCCANDCCADGRRDGDGGTEGRRDGGTEGATHYFIV